MYEVIPGILEKDWSEIERKIEIVKPFASAIHIDIIDGKFAPNLTFLDPLPFKKFTLPSSGQALFFEVHLMVEDPIQYLKPFADVGFKRFIGHIESLRQPADQAEFVAQAQLLGEVGLAVDGPTSLGAIKIPYGDLDCVLVMTVKAGQSGQTFNPEYLKKVETLRRVEDPQRGTQGQFLTIEIDGGINDVTIVKAKNAGATRFVANSVLFNNQNPQEKYNLLKKCLE